MPSDLAVIIDESATSRKILERLIGGLGDVAPHSFADPEAALAFCRDATPGLIVLGEPGDGPAADFIRRLRAVSGDGDPPVLVVADTEDRGSIETAREAGAADHLISPVDHHEFLVRARHLLRRERTGNGAAGRTSSAEHDASHGLAESRPAPSGGVTTEFLYNMSHELRTPLNAIIGFSQVIASEMLGPVGTPKYAGYARDILDSAERLLGIVNDFLDVARLEAGTLELAEETVDPHRIVAELVRLVEARAAAASVRLSLGPEEAVPQLRVDPRKLRQIILNLLTNAIKFSKPGGVVEVLVRKVGGGVVISVADQGIGMDPLEIELATTRFGQVATPWARKHDGTGLGLPLAIGLADLHGARLTIRSTKGVGTTVTVAFPRERSEPMMGDGVAASAGFSA